VTHTHTHTHTNQLLINPLAHVHWGSRTCVQLCTRCYTAFCQGFI